MNSRGFTVLYSSTHYMGAAEDNLIFFVYSVLFIELVQMA